MLRAIVLCLSSLLATAAMSEDASDEDAIAAEATAPAEEAVAAVEGTSDGGPKTLSGMSILGNDEAPTSLVIVPWKSSEISATVGLSNVLNAGIQAVDKDVFMRELSYYEIQSNGG